MSLSRNLAQYQVLGKLRKISCYVIPEFAQQISWIYFKYFYVNVCSIGGEGAGGYASLATTTTKQAIIKKKPR